MHFLYFVTFDKKNAKNSEEARTYANSILQDNSFCCADGGYFSSGKCDWYVVGGRWSSYLQYIQFKQDFFKALEKAKIETHSQALKTNKSQIQAIWKKLGGKSQSPYHRDTYNQHGYADDAKIIDEKLFNALKNNEEYANTEIFDTNDYDEFTIGEAKKENLLGRWLVVIDYHS